uniref:Uncharacterized protein n=1 Tax=Rhizophora mucronata TaxID=61149 RepID=A0A2P2KM87_RHIMU
MHRCLAPSVPILLKIQDLTPELSALLLPFVD